MRQLIVLLALAPLAACAAAPATQANREPHAEPTANVIAAPIVTGNPQLEPKVQPATVRNQGFGPYDTLELVCGADSKRCTMSEANALPAGSVAIAVASFSEQPSDGSTHLALQLADGWYVSMVPDGHPFGGGLSHHSPAGTYFDLKHARPSASGGILIDRRYGMSSFIGGRGRDGSRSFVEVKRLSCRVADGKVSCDDGQLIYSRACQTPMEGGAAKCLVLGNEPAPV